ncbi:MAG: site-specific DNA-methyltransferase [Thermoflexales bacterium]|nr:site-specific DNA-methyltransferase [Thermoflexales bacterium]
MLSSLPSNCARLIYLDPPFNTRKRRCTRLASFEDAFGTSAEYVAFLQPRLEQMHRVLDERGSLFLHCDWRTSHHVRLLLDSVFLPHGGLCVNQIIWHYGLGASRSTRRLLTKHDVIFWYARSEDYVFNPLRLPPTPAMERKYCHRAPDGRRYMVSYGRRYFCKGGKLLDDVWDIPAIPPTAAERVGYPTQKPLALLQRIVGLASEPGDLVLDPFCGSGTTLVAAKLLGRCWLGIDINPDAIAIASQRLAQIG